MKYLIAALLFLGTFSVQAGPNVDRKAHVGTTPDGFVFAIDGQPAPWLCRPLGGGVVSCVTAGRMYTCVFQEPPVYFTACSEGKDEVPLGIIVPAE